MFTLISDIHNYDTRQAMNIKNMFPSNQRLETNNQLSIMDSISLSLMMRPAGPPSNLLLHCILLRGEPTAGIYW